MSDSAQATDLEPSPVPVTTPPPTATQRQPGEPVGLVPAEPAMAKKANASPFSFVSATHRTTAWVGKVGTSTGKAVAAWSAAAIWLLIMYSFLICWYAVRVVFVVVVTLPLRMIRRNRRKSFRSQGPQLTTVQDEQETASAIRREVSSPPSGRGHSHLGLIGEGPRAGHPRLGSSTAIAGPAAADSSRDAVQLVSVSKSYGRRRHRHEALHGVTASFPKGTLTAVMGVSGSGKSTLLQCAAGLDRPSAGSIRIGGIEVTGLRRKKLSVLRRERIGFVFQALNLVPTLSVADNIALPLRLDGRHVDRKRVQEVAGLVGIADKLPRLPDTLSGGQQQRVAIARALITEPEVIFADEPTAALDPYTTEAVLDLLRQAVDELHQTVVVVTHQPSVAAWADRVLLLDRGRVVGLRESPDPVELNNDLRQLGAGEVMVS